MKITRVSIISGKAHSREIAVSQADIDRWQKGGLLIQQAMPDLTPEDREFLMTGITPEEWDTLKEDDDE